MRDLLAPRARSPLIVGLKLAALVAASYAVTMLIVALMAFFIVLPRLPDPPRSVREFPAWTVTPARGLLRTDYTLRRSGRQSGAGETISVPEPVSVHDLPAPVQRALVRCEADPQVQLYELIQTGFPFKCASMGYPAPPFARQQVEGAWIPVKRGRWIAFHIPARPVWPGLLANITVVAAGILGARHVWRRAKLYLKRRVKGSTGVSV